MYMRPVSVLPIIPCPCHRFGKGFYPGTGHPSDAGIGAGEGTSVNVAWTSEGFGDVDYLAAFDRIVMPVAREYGPELVIVSAGGLGLAIALTFTRTLSLALALALTPTFAQTPSALIPTGFDAAQGDPLGGMMLTPAGYAHMTALLATLAGGKLVVALEGGYNLRSTSRCAAAVLATLLGDPPPMLQRRAPKPEVLADMFAGAGFAQVRVRRLSGGIACIHSGWKLD